MIEAYRGLGAPAEFLEELKAGMQRQEDFEVFADNLPSVEVFRDMDTQWQRAGMDGTRTGLRFEAAPVIMLMHEIPAEAQPQVLRDLKVMEHESLVLDAERRSV